MRAYISGTEVQVIRQWLRNSRFPCDGRVYHRVSFDGGRTSKLVHKDTVIFC